MKMLTITKSVGAAAIALLIAIPVAATTLTDTYSSFYSFGDSLTDDGKFGLVEDGGLLQPPSFGGRFTNGLTWSEYIEDDFAAVNKDNRNYALGGATAGDLNVRNPDGPLATLAKQISAFMFELPARTPGDNPLVSLWFGANDIFTKEFTGKTATDAANAVVAGVRKIGAIENQNFDDFLLFKLPAIPGSPGDAEEFNMQLDLAIIDLIDEGFKITTYDPANATNAIVEDTFFNNSEVYGITDLFTPCRESLRGDDPESCLDEGVDPNTRLFVDAVHPNAVAHRLVAEQVNATFDLAAVPLPAGLPLLLVGLGAFAVLRRRAA